MRTVVTGAAGYIGTKLVAELINYGHEVVCFDNFFFNQSGDLASRIEVEEFYIEDVTKWSDNLKREISDADIVIPLAALVGAPLCDRYPNETKAVNQNWFNQLLSYLDNQLVIYPNTNSGYGSTGSQICTEETPCNPVSLYGRTKLESELTLLNNYDHAVCFRLATVFGASFRQRMDLLVNNLVYLALRDGHIEVFDGHFRRNYVHIKDVVSAFMHSIDHCESMKGQVYNLGNDSVNMTKMELVEKICDKTNSGWSINNQKTDPDKRDYIVSSQKLYDTGFYPKFDLDYGINEMVNVYNSSWKKFEDEEYLNTCRNY